MQLVPYICSYPITGYTASVKAQNYFSMNSGEKYRKLLLILLAAQLLFEYLCTMNSSRYDENRFRARSSVK